jgi:hypothetical protein
MPISSGSLVTVITRKGKENFRMANLLLFYVLHKDVA